MVSVNMLRRAMSAPFCSSEDRHRRKLVHALVLSLASFVLGLNSALAWQVTLPTFSSYNTARSLAIDAEGNIITADDSSDRFVVTKLSGSTGQVLWRTTIRGTGVLAGTGISVAVDPTGQVVAGGNLLFSSPLRTMFAVVKLDGATGAERWRFVIDRPDGYASEVAFDRLGDVVACGRVLFGSYAFLVVKLSGVDGSQLWRRSNPGLGSTSEAQALALDPAGDVIAVGYIANDPRNTGFLVERLSGTTGAVVWASRTNTPGVDMYNAATSVALDHRGDVVAAGRVANVSTGRDAFVVKLSGGSGGELWRTTIDGGVGDFDGVNSVAVDAIGDAVLAGTFGLGQGRNEFFVVKVSGDSGTEKWRRIVRGSAGLSDTGFDVVVDAGNDVVATGRTHNTATAADWTAVKLQGSTGEVTWRTDLSGIASNSENDFPMSLGIDSCASVVVSGMTQNTSSTTDYTVLKLSGASGLSSDTFKEGPCAPPRASFAAPGTVECAETSGGVVMLDGSVSTDDDSSPGTNDDIQSFEWFEDYGQATQRSLGEGATLQVTLGLGAHAIALEVTDDAGLSDVEEQTVSVVDTAPPALNCPGQVIEECASPGGSLVTLITTAGDACSLSVALTNSATAGGGDASGFFALGTTQVTFQATDESGNTATCIVPVTVRDTTPPTLTLALSSYVLWPPNHRMESLQAAWQVSDVCDPASAVTLLSAGSSEQDDAPGAGDGSTTDDIQDAAIGTPDESVLLRAERMSGGPGRIYTLLYGATDVSGNTASAPGLVIVPHDLGRSPGSAARGSRSLRGTARTRPAVPSAVGPLPPP